MDYPPARAREGRETDECVRFLAMQIKDDASGDRGATACGGDAKRWGREGARGCGRSLDEVLGKMCPVCAKYQTQLRFHSQALGWNVSGGKRAKKASVMT